MVFYEANLQKKLSFCLFTLFLNPRVVGNMRWNLSKKIGKAIWHYIHIT